jgi:MFS family permease
MVRNLIFASETLPAVVGVALPLHGVSYAFFIMVGSMYIDRKAPLHLRASAQGIFTFVSMGAGTLLGNFLSARVVQSQTMGDVIDWSAVWIIPATLAGIILLAFVTLFRETSDRMPENTTLDAVPNRRPGEVVAGSVLATN